MRINPVFKKDLKLNVRTIRFPLIVAVFNLVLSIVGLTLFYYVLDEIRWYGRIDFDTVVILYVCIIMFEYVLLCFIVPGLTAGSISGERERQTLDILLSSGMTPAQIIFGKLMSSVNTVILLIISSAPVLSLIFVFGGVSLLNLAAVILYLIFMTLLIGTFGITCSTLFKKTTVATVMSYAGILATNLGTIFLYGILTVIYSAVVGYGNYNEPFEWIMLFNPAVSLYYLLARQVGDIGYYSTFLEEFWLFFSIPIQLAAGVLMLLLSIHLLNPLRKKRKG